MERPDSTYMPRLIEDYERPNSTRGIPDDGVDTWFLTQDDWYENLHFPMLNLMADKVDSEVVCLLTVKGVTEYIGPLYLSMDDLGRLSTARKATLQKFHDLLPGVENPPRIDPAPVD